MGERLATFLKLMCIVYLVLFLPRIISVFQDVRIRQSNVEPGVLLGIEHLARNEDLYYNLKGLKFGLLVDDASKDQSGNRTVDVLLNRGFSIKKIGHLRTSQAGRFISFHTDSSCDHTTKLPLFDVVQSAFFSSQSDFFDDIDGLIVDIQTSGMRFDESAQVVFNALDVAAQQDKKVIITDRCNPLGPAMEGPGEIPFRHGMTLGELALYYNKSVLDDRVDLQVIAMQGWDRSKPLDGLLVDTDRAQGTLEQGLFRILSLIDPLEIGTSSNQEQALMFPQEKQLSNWEFNYLDGICKKCGFDTADCSYWDTDRQQLCKGLQLKVKNDVVQCSAFNSLLTMIRFLSHRKTIHIEYSDLFDSAIGSGEVRKYLQGHLNFKKMKKNVEKKVEQFFQKSQNCFLYKPFPQVEKVALVKN